MKGRILGFDFGHKRIGTASGNRATGTTLPLETVTTTRQGPDWPRLVGLVREWRADELVVGLPLHMDGSESTLSREARRFGDELASRTGLPVALVDERLSSSEASHVLTLGSTPGKPRRRQRLTHRDSIAAELIIRTYLADNPAPTCNR